MLLKSAQQAREFGTQIAKELEEHNTVETLQLLNSILRERTPFRLLDLVGAALDTISPKKANTLLDAIAEEGSEGGWVVIASALHKRIPANLADTLEASRKYIIAADIWYGCDIFGERVSGPALIANFNSTLDHLAHWRTDNNAWVRRALGVAGHFWAKRTRSPQFIPQAKELLEFLSPMLEEQDMNAAKGIGWALKSIGRYYPETAVSWLKIELNQKNRRPAAIVKRKALTFLPLEMKEEIRN